MVLNSAIKTARTPNSPKTKLKMSIGAEGVGNNVLVFGAPETGKSTVGAQLACAGQKVFTLQSDIGGTGINGMLAYASAQKKMSEFRQNHRFVTISSKDPEAMESFIDNPESIIEGFWDFDPEWVLWDGTGFYIKNTLVPETEEIVNADQRIEGFEGKEALKAWGYVRNDIVRTLDSATAWKTKGKPINRIFTSGIVYKSKVLSGDPTKPDCVRAYVPTEELDVATSAKKTLGYCFDLAFLTLKDEKGGYKYKLSGEFMKRRYKLKDEYPADFLALWAEVEKQRN